MEYAAVISLINTIERVLNSSRALCFCCCCYHQIAIAVEAQIREAANKLEDAFESHVSNQLLSQSECLDGKPHPLRFSIDLRDLQQDIHSFTEKVKELKQEYEEALQNSLPQEDDDDDAVSSRDDFGGEKSKMGGLSDQFESARSKLLEGRPDIVSCSIVGMPSIGKTTLAKKIFEDPDMSEYFDFHAWVTVGRKRQLEEVLRAIVAQVDLDLKDKMLMVEIEIVPQYLEQSLKGRRFFIVLDDAWDKMTCYHLTWCLPNNKNGSRILVTSRKHDLISVFLEKLEMRLLNKEESWDLLCEKVFAEELCPPQLEKPGKKIAKNCEGLPFRIITVANLLSKAEKTLEYWNKIVETRNSVFRDAYDNMLEVLYPSHEYLPRHFKACFLYIGVFPQKYPIPRSNLFNRLIAEGFVAAYFLSNV